MVLAERIILALLAVLLVSSCRNREANAGISLPALHTVTIRVHPEQAVVSLQGEPGDVTAVVQQTGPLASFILPSGSYNYRVEAEGYLPYEGTFEIPRNKNLEVWLNPL